MVKGGWRGDKHHWEWGCIETLYGSWSRKGSIIDSVLRQHLVSQGLLEQIPIIQRTYVSHVKVVVDVVEYFGNPFSENSRHLCRIRHQGTDPLNTSIPVNWKIFLIIINPRQCCKQIGPISASNKYINLQFGRQSFLRMLRMWSHPQFFYLSEFRCTHEEADTGVLFHVSFAIQNGVSKTMIHATDTDCGSPHNPCV